MPTAMRDVRSRGQSGKHILAVSLSGFDPELNSRPSRLFFGWFTGAISRLALEQREENQPTARKNSRRSALIVAASVVGMPCGKPL
jgi:hypothetical protein